MRGVSKMLFFILMGLFFVISFLIYIINKFYESEIKQFNQNKKIGKAELIGYDRSDSSDWYIPLVEIIGLNDGKLYSCKMNRNGVNYKKGDIIDVEYANIKKLGIEVHSLDNPPKNLLIIFKNIYIVSFIIAIICGVIGILFI